MSKFQLIMASCIMAAILSVSSQAADYGKPEMGMEKMNIDATMMGKHKMAGMVSKIDHAKGTLMLKTSVADMALHFPPSSLKDVKNGDTITVEMSFMKSEPAMK